MREIVERLRDSAESAGSELSIGVADSINGQWDRLRIEQILMNLISNSIKYAAGTPIQVSVCREKDLAILKVQDKGPGIPEADLSRILNALKERHPRGTMVAWAWGCTWRTKSQGHTAE